MFQPLFYPHPLLNQICTSITEFNNEIQEFAAEMEKTLYHYEARGLAANQVGKTIRLFTLMLNNEAVTFINPEVVKIHGNIIKTTEGCLSIPGVRANLNCRNDFIDIKAKTITGEDIKRTLMAAEATAFLHELDHLNGRTFFFHMKSGQRELKKNNYLKRLRKWKKQ